MRTLRNQDTMLKTSNLIETLSLGVKCSARLLPTRIIHALAQDRGINPADNLGLSPAMSTFSLSPRHFVCFSLPDSSSSCSSNLAE